MKNRKEKRNRKKITENLPYLNGAESRSTKWTPPQDLVRTLLNYDVISFDIFDTLVLRPSIFPTDLFIVAGRECKQNDFFALVRKNCESLARQKQTVGEDEISYSDIYNSLKFV